MGNCDSWWSLGISDFGIDKGYVWFRGLHRVARGIRHGVRVVFSLHITNV